MNKNKKLLITSIALPLLVGAAAGLLSQGAMREFGALNQPPLSPPGWLFPVVWTILYTLMGISAYLVKIADVDAEMKSDALTLYHYQLIVNFLWPIFFFNFGWYLFSLIWLILLWVLVFFMIRQFYKISKTAAKTSSSSTLT